jgi:hypothetical protein
VRPGSENSAAAGALGSIPFYKNFAFVASLVTIEIMTLMFMPRGFVP